MRCENVTAFKREKLGVLHASITNGEILAVCITIPWQSTTDTLSMDQFLAQIFAVIHQIPSGKVSTYGEIAKMAGYPGYARHVGNLPEGSKLPWFRVINSQGKISLKGRDLDRQKANLEAEGIEVSELGKVSLRKYKWQP